MLETCGWVLGGVPSRVVRLGIKQGPRANAGREGTPVLTVVTNNEDAPAGPADGGSLIDEIVRDGARRMLAAALEAEVAAYLEAHVGEVAEKGRRPVVRNGHAVPRPVPASAAGRGACPPP